MSKNKRTAKAPAANQQEHASHSQDLMELAHQRQPGLVRELTSMIMQNKKWWLIPIMVMVLALGLIVFLGGTAAAPFIYTLF